MPRHIYTWDENGKARLLPIPAPYPTIAKVTALSLPQMMEKMNEIIDRLNILNDLLLPPPPETPAS